VFTRGKHTTYVVNIRCLPHIQTPRQMPLVVYTISDEDTTQKIYAVVTHNRGPSGTPHTDPTSTPHTDPTICPHTDPRNIPHTDPKSSPHTDPRSTPHTDQRRRGTSCVRCGDVTFPTSILHTDPTSISHAKCALRSVCV